MTQKVFFNNILRNQNMKQTEDFFQEYLNNFIDNHPSIIKKMVEIKKYRDVQQLANNITDIMSQKEE